MFEVALSRIGVAASRGVSHAWSQSAVPLRGARTVVGREARYALGSGAASRQTDATPPPFAVGGVRTASVLAGVDPAWLLSAGGAMGVAGAMGVRMRCFLRSGTRLTR